MINVLYTAFLQVSRHQATWHDYQRVLTNKPIGSVYLTKVTGGPVGSDEAREVLRRFGAIEETCPTTIADQEMRGLPEGCWVKFRYFMDCKDAIAASDYPFQV